MEPRNFRRYFLGRLISLYCILLLVALDMAIALVWELLGCFHFGYSGNIRLYLTLRLSSERAQLATIVTLWLYNLVGLIQ